MDKIIDRPLLAVPNVHEGHADDGQLLLYTVSVAATDDDDDEEEEWGEMKLEARQLPCRFGGHRQKCWWAMAIAGGTIVALTENFQDTLLYDTSSSSAAAAAAAAPEPMPGPRLHDYKPAAPAMVPVGDDTVVVMTTVLPGTARCCSFEALRRRQQLPGGGGGGGGGWQAFRLPEPPLEIERGRTARASAYLALGTRLWISVTGEATFSLDVVNGGNGGGEWWRKEGGWELPLYGRAMFVPELGAVIGIANYDGGHCLCAVDMEARPPVLRHVWEEETFPVAECLQVGHRLGHHMVTLAHLGDGAFCICRPINVERDERGYHTRDDISYMAVQLRRCGGGSGREIELTRRSKLRYCDEWLKGYPFPCFIQP